MKASTCQIELDMRAQRVQKNKRKCGTFLKNAFIGSKT